MAPRNAWEQARRAARPWAEAEIEALKLPADSYNRRLGTWGRLLHRAGITPPAEPEKKVWVRGRLPIQLSLPPGRAAEKISGDAVGHWLTAGARLMWLSVLVSRPERVRSLGRIYTAADCRVALLQVDDLLADRRTWAWANRFLGELSWRFRLAHLDPEASGGFVDHKSAAVIRAVNDHAFQHGIPSLPNRLRPVRAA